MKNLYKDSLKEFLKNNKLISKAKQRFNSKRHNVFNGKIDNIAFSSNDASSIDWFNTNNRMGMG